MTPKEKANELFTKMIGDVVSKIIVENEGNELTIEMDKLIAKQNALICVSEILQVLWHNHEKNSEKMYRYYTKVKKEIEKL